MLHFRHFLLVVLSLVCSATHAQLIDRNNGMIYDTDLNITWLADASYALTSGYDADGLMTFQEANDWAAQLEFGGYDDWRLAQETSSATAPYCTGFDCADTEVAHLYYFELGGAEARGSLDLTGDHGPFINIFHQYWTGLVVSDTRAMNFHFLDGFQIDHLKEDLYPGWAVRDGDVAAATVPVPAAAWLLLSGLAFFASVSRTRKHT